MKSPACLLASLLAAAVVSSGSEAPGGRPALALELAGEGDDYGAAIEFRRAALAADDPETRAGLFWMAAYCYRSAGLTPSALGLLDRAEDLDDRLEPAALWLRGELAGDEGAWHEAAFYYEAATHDEGLDEPVRRSAARRAAAAWLRAGEPEASREALGRVSGASPEALAAWEDYRRGKDKSPLLGGTLGLVPGLGYAYSGEIANALRSLILNGLFLFGMIDTAANEQWGAFTAITFFEITWYTGSIYGGVDAAHRYNRRRLETAAEALAGTEKLAPDFALLPAVSLRISF